MTNPKENLCKCGCGLPTTFYKGKYRNFIKGHNAKGIEVSKETRQKLSLAGSGKLFSEKHKQNLSKALKGKRLSDEHKQNISKALKDKKLMGEKSHNWRGGLSFFPYSAEFTPELRMFIRNRDNNECQNPYCSHLSKKLDIHHINYDKMNCNQFNLITLCQSCNSKANHNRKEWKRFYKRIIWSKYT